MSDRQPITELFVVSGPERPPPPLPQPLPPVPITPTSPRPPIGMVVGGGSGGGTGGGGKTVTQTKCFDETDGWGNVIGKRCVLVDVYVG